MGIQRYTARIDGTAFQTSESADVTGAEIKASILAVRRESIPGYGLAAEQDPGSLRLLFKADGNAKRHYKDAPNPDAGVALAFSRALRKVADEMETWALNEIDDPR